MFLYTIADSGRNGVARCGRQVRDGVVILRHRDQWGWCLILLYKHGQLHLIRLPFLYQFGQEFFSLFVFPSSAHVDKGGAAPARISTPGAPTIARNLARGEEKVDVQFHTKCPKTDGY